MIENHFLGKPEIYWIGLTSLVGVATLMIIFFYTLYTRRMMKLAEENRRADISVVLSLREYDFGNFLPIASRPFEIGNFICVVRNIGRGPAAGLQAWHNEVSDRFTLGNIQIPALKSKWFKLWATQEGNESRDLWHAILKWHAISKH